MRYILHFAIVLSFLYSGPLMARNPVLLPLPQKYVRTNASFHPKEIAVSSEGKLRSILMEFLEELPVSVQPDSRYKIAVSLVDKLDGNPPQLRGGLSTKRLFPGHNHPGSVRARGLLGDTDLTPTDRAAREAIFHPRLRDHRLACFPHTRIHARRRAELYLHERTETGDRGTFPLQDERISLASHGEPSLASGEQDLSDAERQLQYEPYARKILHDRGGKGAGSLL